MAKLCGNLVLDGISGRVGEQLVVRNTKHGQVLCIRPRKPSRPLSPAQLAQQRRFADAIAYASANADHPAYAERALQRGVAPRIVATADFLHPPEIRDIDLSRYHGKAGDTIEALATDDVLVERVGIAIVGPDNVLIERGAMRLVRGCRWTFAYQATRDADVGHVRVIVDAADLAGQIVEEAEDAAL
jgi:hypothetical protein